MSIAKPWCEATAIYYVAGDHCGVRVNDDNHRRRHCANRRQYPNPPDMRCTARRKTENGRHRVRNSMQLETGSKASQHTNAPCRRAGLPLHDHQRQRDEQKQIRIRPIGVRVLLLGISAAQNTATNKNAV